MNRRILVALVAGGALALTACGAAPSSSTASDAAPTSSTSPSSTAGAGGSSGERASSTELDELQSQADRVLEELFEADRDLDYETIAGLTSRAVAARYRNQELLGSIEALDDRWKVPAMESVTVTSDLEVLEPSGGAVGTTGDVTVTYTDDEGNEEPYTFTDIVFEQDGDDLLVADWFNDAAALPASAAFLNTTDVEPETVGDLTVELEPGYRDPAADPAFVEYVFTVANDGVLDVDVVDVEIIAPDNETYGITFGVADTIEPGDTRAARVGFEGPSVPVAGGTMTITLEDENGDQFLVFFEAPAFLDADGDAEEPETIELADVEFTSSGTVDGGDPTTPSSEPEVLQEITDAAAFRDSLLAIAAADVDPSDPASGWGIPDAWMAAVAGLELVGIQIEATPTTVSGFSITGAKDGTTEGLPFAVVDSSGRCAGGVIMGSGGVPTDFLAVDISGAATCNAAAVIDAVDLA
jgi:hypothetical protein